MKKWMTEFKEFINRGNVMDLAVGVIIGGAFTTIVTSLTGDIINPFIKLVTGGNGSSVTGLSIPVAGTPHGIDFGAFISAIINFLLVALVVFFLVKMLARLQRAGSAFKKDTTKTPASPTCPFCLEVILPKATRCSHCTAELPSPATPRNTSPQ